MSELFVIECDSILLLEYIERNHDQDHNEKLWTFQMLYNFFVQFCKTLQVLSRTGWLKEFMTREQIASKCQYTK